MRIAPLFLSLLLAAPAFAQQAPTPQPTPAPTPAPPTASQDEDIPDASEQEIPDATAEEAVSTPARDPNAMDPAPADPSLRGVFDSFGGEAGLTALMDDYMKRLVADPRTNGFFANVDQASVKRHLVEQFCAILGGGCTYTGRDMRSAHEGLNIQRAQFNALVEILQQAMSARHIPFRAQNQLLAKLAPLHRDIEHR
jgi:hemoglobin